MVQYLRECGDVLLRSHNVPAMSGREATAFCMFFGHELYLLITQSLGYDFKVIFQVMMCSYQQVLCICQIIDTYKGKTFSDSKFVTDVASALFQMLACFVGKLNGMFQHQA